MNEIIAAQVNLIARDVKRQHINFSHLCEDLIDHICCDVENEMQSGLTFELAYARVKEKIGLRGLIKIQEETLYSVDTKYRRMKNLMKITGIAGTVLLSFAATMKLMHLPLASLLMVVGIFMLVVLFLPSSLMVLWKETKKGGYLLLFISGFFFATLFITGALFKIQHWPGSGILISLSVLTGALIFFPSFLVYKIKETQHPAKKPVYILAFISAFILLVYSLFKIMHWPGASLMMFLADIVLMILIPWYVVLEWKEEKNVSSKFIFLVIALIAVAVPVSLINLNIQPGFDDGFYIMEKNSRNAVQYSRQVNEDFLAQVQDTVSAVKLETIHRNTVKVLNHIDTLKSTLTSFAGTENIADVDKTRNYIQVANLFDYTSPQGMLNPGTEPRKELDRHLIELMKETGALAGDPDHMELRWHAISSLLPDSSDRSNSTLISNLHILNLLEINVLLAEYDAFMIHNTQTSLHE